eukprot:g5629.t1
MEKRSSERQRRRAKKLAHIRKQREELMNLERELGKFKENSMSTALPFSPSPQNSPLRAKTPKKSPLMPSPQNSPMRVKTPKKSPLMERTPTKSPLQENSPRSSPRIQFYQPLSSRLSPSPKKVSSRISPSPKKTPPQRVQRQGSSVLSAVRKQLSGIDDILSPKRRNSVEKKAKIKASPASADFESMRKRNKSAANFLSQQNSKNSPAPAPSPERPRALPFTEAKVSPESKTAPKTIDVSAAVLQGKEDLIEIKDCVSEKEASSKDKGETRSKDSESQWYNSKVDKIIEVWSPQKGEPETSNLSADSLAGAFSVEGDLTLDAAEVLAGLGNADVDPEDQMKEEEGTFESSALRIQAFWRGAAERKYRLTLLNKRTKNAVILIQRCFRGWCCRSKLALEGTGSTLAGEDTDVGSPNSQTAGSFVDDYMVGVHNYVINGLIMNQTVESAYQCSPGTNSMMLNNSEMVSFSESNFGATPGKISPVPKMVDTSLMGHAALQEEMNSVMKQEVNPDETLSDAEEVLALDESALLLNESLKTIRKQMADAEEEVSAHRVTSPMEDVEAEMDAAATWETRPIGDQLLRRKHAFQKQRFKMEEANKHLGGTSPSSIREVPSSPYASKLLMRKYEHQQKRNDEKSEVAFVAYSPLREESSPIASRLMRRKFTRGVSAIPSKKSDSTPEEGVSHEFQKQQHASAAAATDAIPSSPNATRILMRKHEIFKERQLVSSTDDFSIPAPATSSPVSSRLLQRKLEIQKSQSEANGHDFNNFSVDISTPEKSSPISFELLRRKHAAMRGSIESMQTATLETSPASSILWEKKRMNQRNQESNLKEGDEGASASLQSRAVEMTDNEIPVDSPIAQFNLSKFDNPLGRRQKEAILVVARRRNLMKFPKQGDNELNAPSVRHSVASMEMSNSGKSNSVRGPEGKSGASLIMEMKIQREKLEARRDAQKRKKYNDRVSRGKKVLLNILGANEEILPGQQMSGTREAIDDLDADYVLNTSMNQVEESGEEAVVASLFVDERPSLQENLLPFGVHRNTAPEKDEMPHASPIKEMNVHDVQAEADMVPVRQLIAAVQPVRRRSVAMTFDMTDDGPCESRNFPRKKKMPKVRKPVRSAETAPIAVHEVVKQEVVQKPVEVQKPKIENFDMKKFMNPYEYREEEAKKNPQVMTFDMHNHDDGGHGPEVRKLKIMEARERKIAKLKRRQALQEKRKQIRAEERKLLKEKKMKKEQRIKDVQSHDMMGIVGSRWRPEDEAKDNLNREQEAWANVEQEVNYLGEEEPLNLEGIIPMSEIELHMSDEAPLRHKSRLRQPSAGLQYQRESAMRAAAAAMENPARGISKSRAAKATARRYGGKGGGSGDGFSDVPERSRRYAPPGKRNGAVMLPRKLAGPSNRKKVFLALKNVCLAGAHLAYEHGDARRAIENSTASSFVVLMGNTRALNYRGLYAKNPITKVQTRIHGTGPEVLEPHMITEYFKYSTSVRNFQAIPGTKDFTATTDAVTVKPKFLKKTRKFSSGLDYRDQVFEKLDHHRGRVQLM